MPTLPTSTLQAVRPRRSLLSALGIVSLLALSACPDEPQAPPSDLGTPTGDDLGCYAAPTTHLEILNACTSAQSLTKQPVLPLLRPDGTLPPLP